uniref:TIR domain-containing protein n=1 Tax=Lactuca sativa TaxID=4236 RepID=A0A9R1WFJ4_LACSA|nr:hypothetical protein LSAT_V11C200062110 [Lactuca sativa]
MASSSKVSIQKSYKYDVFLSFRGEDTRKNFVDHLYAALEIQGIHTFKDDERLEKGKKMNDELLKSIEESKFYIVVFSKNYASSTWCLDELVKIMECQKVIEQIAYPVFYDVDPSEVRKQLGRVGEAFSIHNNEGKVEKWREALREASNLAGWDLRNTADGHEAKVINKIVKKISLELRFNNLEVDRKLIGMESRVKDIVSLMEMGIEDVRLIGIKGIGGGGKTTLVRAVFDKICFSFEGKSFVENVREVSKSSMFGLRSLQEQVLFNVLNNRSYTIGSVHKGKSLIQKMLCSKKVLLILDDVDHLDQLEALAGGLDWFKPGSRIIITTRDEQVLVAHGVTCIRDVNMLSQDEAMCLLSRYAFGRDIPIQSYKELSLKVVHYAAGLPLTIRVLGSFLCGQNELEWEDAIERLKTIPLKETLEKLELSYTGLEDDYKEIFLDVACLLKGWKKDKAIRALESCGFRARNGLRVLEQKSLITISPNMELGMHDHIEEMGRNIARRSDPNEPIRHSRLWIRGEIEDVFAKDLFFSRIKLLASFIFFFLGLQVTEATRAIAIQINSSGDNERPCYEILTNGFGNMKNLRFLHVDSDTRDWPVNIGVGQNLPNALRFLSWRRFPHCSLPKTFQANNLVSLQISSSIIIQLWEDGERKVLKNLKFLDFSYSHLRTLDCGLLPNLEKLNLANCCHLVEFHAPIGSLTRLVCLDLSECILLKSLSFIKQLESLQQRYQRTTLSNWNLRKLVSLDLNWCKNLKSLPQSICSLQHLKDLDLESCAIEELPEDIGYLESLEWLNLRLTLVKHLPNSICMLKRLKTLLLSRCYVFEKLPEDLGLLESLEELSVTYCKIRDVPSSICKLKHLREFDLRCCDQLKKLPEKVGSLKCLQVLDVQGTSISHLPQSISLLKALKIFGFKSEDQSIYT